MSKKPWPKRQLLLPEPRKVNKHKSKIDKGNISDPRLGIGLAIAKKLLSANANVVVLARDAEALKRIQDDNPDRIRTLPGDMNDLSLPQQAVDLALKEFGRLDAVIVNHGTMEPVARIENSDIHEWRKLFDVNFFSAVAFVSVSGAQSQIAKESVGQSCVASPAKK